MSDHNGPSTIEPNRVYSREEAAQLLDVSVSTVKRLVASGKLRVSRPPGMRRVLILGQHLLELRADKQPVLPSSR